MESARCAAERGERDKDLYSPHEYLFRKFKNERILAHRLGVPWNEWRAYRGRLQPFVLDVLIDVCNDKEVLEEINRRII